MTSVSRTSGWRQRAAGRRRGARWVVTSTTRRRGPTIIMRTGTPPQSSASSSVWPLPARPAATRLALQIGAVDQRVGVAVAHQPHRFDDRGVGGAAAGDARPAGSPLARRQASARRAPAARRAAAAPAAPTRRSARARRAARRRPRRRPGSPTRIGRQRAPQRRGAAARRGSPRVRCRSGRPSTRRPGARRSRADLHVVALAQVLLQPAVVALLERLGVELLLDLVAPCRRAWRRLVARPRRCASSRRTMWIPVLLRTGLLNSPGSRSATAFSRSSRISPFLKVPSLPPLFAAPSSDSRCGDLGEVGAVLELVVDLLGARLDLGDLFGRRVGGQLEEDLRDRHRSLAAAVRRRRRRAPCSSARSPRATRSPCRGSRG